MESTTNDCTNKKRKGKNNKTTDQHFHATLFFVFRIDNVGNILCTRAICSQSTSLTALFLTKNEIGAAGATSIGDALSYIKLFFF